ncbi:MAG: GNAT family N-acetyltransferase [Acidimicrobiales bacterium]
MRLRPYAHDDETPAREANEVMKADGSRLLFYLDDGVTWDQWLKKIDEHRRRLSLSVGIVPATQLVADVDDVIVGSARIRFSLNKELERTGGHIGYGVLPAHRRRGYATEILRQALIIARSQGVSRVLVTCLDDNVGSACVIERCGGVLEDVIDIDEGSRRLRRYWFT